ncbi:MAG: DUF3471 domain-containing protein, partial [Chloroflexi bacterium]|nr:DUF3471 domain-containing protein [Chloroflexota bacterium]
ATFPIMLNLYDRLLGLDQLALNDIFLNAIKKMELAAEKGKEKSAEQRKVNTKPSHELKEYAGNFSHPGYGILKVEKNGDKLKMVYNALTYKLDHYHYDIFEAVNEEEEEMSMKVSFFTDTQGNIASISAPLESNVKDIVFTRVAPEEMFKKSFLEQFAGKYRFMETQTFEVAMKENLLTLAMMGQSEMELEPYMGTQFNVKGAPASIEFKMTDGKVTGADLLQGGAAFYAEKIE